MSLILTKKQRAVIRLARAGHGPSEIARATGLHRVTVSELLSRAKRNIRRAGINPERVLSGEDHDILDLIA